MDKRLHALSATNKMKYISESVIENNIVVEFISPSWSILDSGWLKKEKIFLNEQTMIQYFFSFGSKNKISKKINEKFILLQLFLYLFFCTKQNEEVIVYHSPALISLLIKLKKIKKLKIILEIEEVYSDISGDDKMRQKEYNFFDFVDAYIFPTEIMNDKINTKNKPYIIIYGAYLIEKQIGSKFDDDKIHIVYAGTFDETKGGAYLAIESSKYLDDKYQLHILGFGTENQKQKVVEYIQKINLETKCVVKYHGVLIGNEYICFLQKCQIGLSTQNTSLKYNETSFPSKILSYMSNGLRVVSGISKCLEKAEIKQFLYFYTGNSAENIADTIKKIDFFSHYDSREEIKKLNKKCVKNINELIKNLD